MQKPVRLISGFINAKLIGFQVKTQPFFQGNDGRGGCSEQRVMYARGGTSCTPVQVLHVRSGWHVMYARTCMTRTLEAAHHVRLGRGLPHQVFLIENLRQRKKNEGF